MFTSERFIAEIAKFLEHSTWKKFDENFASTKPCGVSCVSFMNGQLEVEEKERKNRQKQAKADILPETQPEKLQSLENEEKSTTDSRVKFLQSHCLPPVNQPVGFFNFVINPHSFAETVENIFDVSFIIKQVILDWTCLLACFLFFFSFSGVFFSISSRCSILPSLLSLVPFPMPGHREYLSGRWGTVVDEKEPTR